MRWILALIIMTTLCACDRDSRGVDLPGVCNGRVLIHDNDWYDEGIQDPGTSIHSLSFDAPCLSINLSYGGGCQEHIIDLVMGTHVNSPIDGGPLPKVFSKLMHNNQDDCEALITEDVVFDLSPILEIYDQRTFNLLISNGDHLHSINLAF